MISLLLIERNHECMLKIQLTHPLEIFLNLINKQETTQFLTHSIRNSESLKIEPTNTLKVSDNHWSVFMRKLLRNCLVLRTLSGDGNQAWCWLCGFIAASRADLASSVGWFVHHSNVCSLLHSGGQGSIPGAGNLDSGFHPFRVGKMSM